MLIGKRPTWIVIDAVTEEFPSIPAILHFGIVIASSESMERRTTYRSNVSAATVLLCAAKFKFQFGKLRCEMLSWALTFLIVALIAAALGFGGVAGAATGIAKILFFVFLVLFLISLVVPRMRSSV